MATKLEEFREQYPQYNSVDDETLANSLYERYYKSEMDVDTYRQSMGLDPIAKEPEQPSIVDRIKNAFSSSQDTPKTVLDKKNR